MAPSQESQALAELFKTIAASFPQDDNHFLARSVYDQVSQAASEASGVTIEDVIATSKDLSVPCKRFTPAAVAKKRIVLYMHGGGYSFGSANGHRKLTAHLAKACQSPVLSVDYRLAPENKYPAALDDCVTAYEWLLNTEKYQAGNIIVAGDSVGGALSAILPLALLRKGVPLPAGSIALSPSYDSTTFEGGSLDTNESKDVLNTKQFMKMLVERYVDGSGSNPDDPLISPLQASDKDLAKLPATWISVAGDDMLKDHGVKFAERLEKNGVSVVLDVHEGQQHVFEFMVGKAPEATESIKKIGSWVKELKANRGSAMREAIGMVDM